MKTAEKFGKTLGKIVKMAVKISQQKKRKPMNKMKETYIVKK